MVILTSTSMPGAVITGVFFYNSFWRFGGVRVRSKKDKHSPCLIFLRSVKVEFTLGFEQQ